MSKITLDVDEKNLETLMNILENLKEGLITSIKVDEKLVKQTRAKYEPKTNKVIKEGARVEGKYMNAAAYKKKIQGK